MAFFSKYAIDQMAQYLIESIVFSAEWIKSVNQSLNNYKHSMIMYVQVLD